MVPELVANTVGSALATRHVQISELESLLSLSSSGTGPLFLRRNLPHNTAHRRRRLISGEDGATHYLTVTLQLVESGQGFGIPLPVVVAACVRTVPKQQNGTETNKPAVGFSPISARAVAVTSAVGHGRDPRPRPPVTVRLPLPLVSDILPADISVVILHHRDQKWSEEAMKKIQASGSGGGGDGGMPVACSIGLDAVFERWIPAGDYESLHSWCSMVHPNPLSVGSRPLTSFSVLSESRVLTHKQFGDTSRLPCVYVLRPHVQQQADAPAPADGGGSDGDAAMTKAPPPPPPAPVNEAVESPRIKLTVHFERKPTTNTATATPTPSTAASINDSIISLPPSPAHVLPSIPLRLCSQDGRFCTTTWARPSSISSHVYVCPLGACTAFCRGSLGLRLHLEACHPYLEFHFSGFSDDSTHASDRTPNTITQPHHVANGNGAGPSTATIELEIFARARTAYFDADGFFLPRIVRSDVQTTDSLYEPFIATQVSSVSTLYYCPPHQRYLRYYLNSTYPLDMRDYNLERRLIHQYYGQYYNADSGIDPRDPSEHAAANAVVTMREELHKAAQRRHLRLQRQQQGLGGLDEDITEAGVEQREEGVARNRNDARRDGRSQPPTTAGGGGGGTAVRQQQRALQRHHQRHLPKSQRNNRNRRIDGLSLLTPNGNPKFYHSKTVVAMTQAELAHCDEDSDSDGDDDEWQRECAERLAECKELCHEEREFMNAWNLFVYKHPIHADAHTTAACVAFAKQHARRLKVGTSSFRKCFTAHVTNLWKFRLLTPEQMKQVLGTVKVEVVR